MSESDGDAPGRDFMDAAGYAAGAHLLQPGLELYRQLEADGSAEPAFEALTLIAEAVGESLSAGKLEQLDPATGVAIPWWALRALYIGWGRYRSDGLLFEQAFNVPRRGKANPLSRGPAVNHPLPRRDKETYHKGLALEMAAALKAGGKVDGTAENIARRWSNSKRKVSKRTVLEAWSNYGEEARKQVEHHHGD